MTFIEEIANHKKMSEFQYVISLYNDPTLFDEYSIESTNINNDGWRMYYKIIEDMVGTKEYSVIDNMNVDLFVAQNPKRLESYEKFGGWGTIEEGLEYVETENIANYRSEVIRYSAIVKMIQNGLPVKRDWDKISQFTYEELHAYSEGIVSEIFSGSESAEDKLYDIKDGMWDMIEKADKGISRGLPVYSNLLNSHINGQILGNITMLAGSSGTGKTYLTLCLTMPSFIKEDVPLMIMCNEEDLDKWQRELVTWTANNVIAHQPEFKNIKFVKSRFYQGAFTKDEWAILKAANDWVQEKISDGLITFVNFNSFSMDKAIRLIKTMTVKKGIKYFIIDTLKLDNDTGSNVSDISWLQLQQNMVKLYNVIKPSAKNVHVWVTYQLNKTNRSRFLDQSSLGMSKNVADVVSTLLLTRKILATEKKQDANGLTVKSFENREVALDPEKDYRIVFIDKNRSGSTSKQIVLGVDMGRNIIRDVGYTIVPEDY